MGLYRKYLSIQMKGMMQYKTSFFLTAAGQFLVTFTAFLGIWFLFGRFHEVEGFRFSEVLLCFSVVLAAFSLAESFARGFDTFSGMIGNGEFDRILVRPRNEIFQVLASKVELTRIGRLVQAAVMLVYAIVTCEIQWNVARAFLLVGMIAGGTALFCGLFLIYAAICFFTLEGLEFMNVLTDGGREFGMYPIAVYGAGVLKFCTYVIPYAWFQYFPLLYLTGRSDNAWILAAPLVCFLFLVPCWLLWRFGLRRYQSTGS